MTLLKIHPCPRLSNRLARGRAALYRCQSFRRTPPPPIPVADELTLVGVPVFCHEGNFGAAWR